MPKPLADGPDAFAPVLAALAALAGAPAGEARLLVVPAPAGPRIARLRRTNAIRAVLVPIPSAHAPSRLASFDACTLALALSTADRVPRWVRRAAVTAPGRLALGFGAPAVAVVTPPGRHAPLPLERVVPGADLGRLVILSSTAYRGVAGAWPALGNQPAAWVKVGDVAAEERALLEVAAGARGAGAVVPDVVGREGELLAVRALAGVQASRILPAAPGELANVLDRVVGWLVDWVRGSVTERVATPADLDRWLLGPARALAAYLDPGYPAWLTEAFAPLAGRTCRLGPAHQDLTMFNVLVDRGAPGVIDWEAATPATLPFIDVPYAIVDAAAAADGYRDRVDAFARIFGESGRGSRAEVAVRRWVEAAAQHDRLAGSAAFHACWLGHAVNDLERRGPGGAFVRIAAQLSAAPLRHDPLAA